MNRRHFVVFLALILGCECEPKAADSGPTAEEIMKLVRMSYALQDYKLKGSLRDDTSGKKEAFELTMQQQQEARATEEVTRGWCVLLLQRQGCKASPEPS